HEHLAVLMDDVERDRLRAEGAALRSGNEFNLEPLTGAHLARRGHRGFAVEPNVATRDQRLQVTARELGGKRDDRAIETLPMQGRVDNRLAAFRGRAP